MIVPVKLVRGFRFLFWNPPKQGINRFFLDPLPPTMTTFVNNRTNWNQTTDTITIRASQSPLSDGFNLDHYFLNGTTPGGGTSFGGFGELVKVDEDLRIGGFNSGTVYSLLLGGFTHSNSCNLSSLTSTVVDNVCTGKQFFRFYSARRNSSARRYKSYHTQLCEQTLCFLILVCSVRKCEYLLST